GLGSGFLDEAYSSVGAEILNSIEEVYAKSEMIIKVKEPLKQEYSLIKNDQIIYTFFHFASSKELTQAMIDSGSICIAYETIQNKDRTLPLLTPMSEVAGRMATQQGAKFLEKPQSGYG
ncbi:MAG: alanine dehydrogenase, partial [Flavobacteriales bacterium]